MDKENHIQIRRINFKDREDVDLEDSEDAKNSASSKASVKSFEDSKNSVREERNLEREKNLKDIKSMGINISDEKLADEEGETSQDSDQKNNDKKIGIIQAILVVAFISGSLIFSQILQSAYTAPSSNGGKERVLLVDVKDVVLQKHKIKFSTTGVISSRSNIEVIPQVSGKVIWVNDQFFAGGEFKKNDVLFKIDPIDFELEVKRLKAEVAKAQTLLDLEKAESEAALAEWQSFNVNKKPPELVLRKPQLQEAKANLQAAKAQLENAELVLNRTEVRMPFDGRVVSSNIGAGRFVNSSQSYGIIYGVNDLEIKSSLNDNQMRLLLLSEDKRVKIEIDYLGKKREFFGRLKRASASVESDTRFSQVAFTIEEEITSGEFDKLKLVPGLFAKIYVTGPEIKNVAIVPSSSIQKEQIMWKVEDDKKITKLVPNIIYQDEEVIIFDNLGAKAKIVTSKISGGIEGMKIDYLLEGQKEKSELGSYQKEDLVEEKDEGKVEEKDEGKNKPNLIEELKNIDSKIIHENLQKQNLQIKNSQKENLQGQNIRKIK